MTDNIEGVVSADQRNQPMGQMFFRHKMPDGQEGYFIVSFNFYNVAGAKDALRFAEEWGCEGLTDVINLKVQGENVTPHVQEVGPGCPYHGEKFLAISRKPGTMFCKAKLLDGSYCKHTQPI